ncbi:MAG: hypothetical protein KJT03_15965, partial [Verrucomicrobiae bacterium]|nr:hypothetical protein [Verrucomicrobiae bacterium]
IGGNIFYSGNQGDSWDRLDPSGLTPGWNAVAIEKVGNYLYLFSSENNQGKIFRLDVSGMSFDPSTQVTLNPVGGTVIEGNVIALEGDAIGNGPVSYQWYRDGVAIQGATEKTLTLDPIALEDDGFYTFTATAGGETVESEGAFVIVKARSIGTVDDQFDLRFPPFNLAVTQIAYDALIDTEGNLWVTGRLRSSGNRVLKVNPLSGEILAEAATTAEGRSLAEDSMGKIWAGTNNAWLHRISKDGTIDFTVDINLGAGSGRVNKIIPYGDEGKVFIAGLFDTVGGVLTGPVALLNHDGTLDTSFTFDSANLATTDIADIDVFPDGSLIVVTNTFTTNPVYKLNSNGSVDTNWWLGGKRDGMEQGNVNGDTNAVRILPSGQFLIGFRHTNGTNTNVITNKANLMRFHADGTWDDTFNPEGTGPGGEVFAIEMAPDGKIVIVGDFDGYSDATNTSANRNITRLLANGTVDTYWNPGAEGNRGDVLGASFDDRGNVFIASDHTWYNNVNLNRVLKLVGDVASLDILGDPQSLTLDLGETATFQVFTFGTTAVSYQWRKDGVEIPGANSDILELTNIDDGDDGYYDVVVSNESGQLISQAARLMTISIPKFVAQPEAQNILVGDELTLSVEAIGLGDLTYQWFFEGEEIAGATGASYMIAFPSIANSGSYSVEVTGSAGTSTSSQALVYVEPFAGALDLSFKVNPGFNQAVYDVLELEDGSLIVGGAFTQYNGVAKSHIAKVDKFGNLDADWPQVNAPNVWVRTIQQLDNGQLLLGGPFSSGNGWEWGIVRMNLDGTIDADF